ncbi:MAG: hypothetical protein JW750_09435 [Anaerolineaceae bacterium]|nr:hypothetical protein [Anaerolineaceae bacterium]
MLPDENDLILIAVMPNRRDLELARLLGWYRIPLRSAPKVIEVDYIAFYQPASFGDSHRWRVEYFAEMRGHELLKRKELFRDEPDHPRAEEEYYKLSLGPMCERSEPIVAVDWKRLTFLYTTGRQFSQARTLNDLVVHNQAERTVLWRSLRERGLRGRQYQTQVDEGAFDFDPNLFFLLGGIQEETNPYLDDME